MSTITTTVAASPKAANPAASPADTAPIRVLLADTRDTLSYRVGVLFNAARLLAVHQRGHDALSRAAAIDPEMAEQLGRACPVWRDPGMIVEDQDVLPDLLRVACDELEELVGRVDLGLARSGVKP